MPPRFVARKAQPKVAAVMETAEVCFRGLPPQLTDSQLMQFLRPKIGVNAIGVSKRSPKGEVFLRVPEPAIASVIQALDGLKEVDGTQLPAPLRVTRADGPDVSFGSPVSRENKSSTACTFWQKGNCPRGDDCRFSHSGDRAICFSFQKGNCPHGASCRFSHDTPTTPGQDRASVLGPCFAFQKGNCPNGANCRFAHDTANSEHKMPSTPKSHLACHLFQKGSCPHGADCRFSHTPNFSSPGFEHKKSDVTRPCLNFVNGKCTSGENCVYSHDPQVTGGPRPCFNFQKGICTRGADCGYSHSRDMACFAFNKGNCTRGANCEFAHEAAGPRPCFNFQRGMCNRGEDCHFAHDNGKRQIKLSKEAEFEIKLLARKLLNNICDGKLYAHLPETPAEEFHMKQESEEVVRRQLEMHKQRMKNMQFDSLLPLPSSAQEGSEFRRLGFTKTTTLPAITMDSKRGFVTHEFKNGSREAPLFKSEAGSSVGRKEQGQFGDVSDDKDHWGTNGYNKDKDGRGGALLSRPSERSDGDRSYNDQSRNPYVTGSNTYQDDKREDNSFREKRPRSEDSNPYRQRDDRERDYHDSYDKRSRGDDMDTYTRHRDYESDKRGKIEDSNSYRTRDDYDKRSRNDDINNHSYRSNDRESDKRSKSHDGENNSYRERDDKRRDTNLDNNDNPYLPSAKTSEAASRPPPPTSELDAPPGMSRSIPIPPSPLRSVADVSHWLLIAEDNINRGSDPFEAVSQVASNLNLSDRPGTVNQATDLLARGEVTTTILDRYLKVLERMDSRSRPIEVRGSDGSLDHVRVDILTKDLQDALRSFKQKKLISLTSNLKTSSTGSKSERSSRKRSSSPSYSKHSSSPTSRKRSPSPRRSDRRDKRSASPSERRDRHRDRAGHKKEKRDREKPSRSTEKRRRSRSHSRSLSSS